MTKNETILFNLLKLKGINVKEVKYDYGFAWDPATGWWATDNNHQDIFLGKTYQSAKNRIDQNKLDLPK